MNRFKQCAYTLILLITCLIASPIIYKQIWDSSKEKKKAENYKPPVIDLDNPAVTQPNAAITTTDSAVTTAPQQGQDVTPTDTGIVTTASEEQPTTENNVFVYTQSDPSYFDDAAFIGDSRTVGIRDYGTLKNAYYYCDVGLAASKVTNMYIPDLFGGRSFKKVYIMLGINEVGNDIEYTVSAFRNIIEGIKEAQPDAIIYLMANLHVTQASETSLINNARINMLNGRIAEFADNTRIFYLDINPVFDDETGSLRADCTGDGVHVYGSYYDTWCQWLCRNTVVNQQ